MTRSFTIALALCLTISAMAQSLPYKKHRAFVYKDEYYVSPSQYDYSAVTDTIVGDAVSSYEKARRIFLWICGSITYDASQTIRTADEAWNKRSAVCQGYCELFYRMAETQQIHTKLIYGTGISPYTGDNIGFHVWAEVGTDRGNILIDPTWGAGRSLHGWFMKNKNPDKWFDMPADSFSITHIPKVKPQSKGKRLLQRLKDLF